MKKNGTFSFDHDAATVTAVEPLLPPASSETAPRVRVEGERPCFYTARELARFLRVTETTIYRLAKRGELSSFAFGRSVRFRAQDVEAFVRRSKVDRDAPAR